ncbi:MAG: hypothetical protein J5927_05485 [Oscillospiraceae bacterium]|nr:hypothetical protein [Oscillospiraceae bacterium]
MEYSWYPMERIVRIGSCLGLGSEAAFAAPGLGLHNGRNFRRLDEETHEDNKAS